MKALSEAEALLGLQRFAEQTEEFAILLTDREGVIQWCNGGAERIVGASREELVGRSTASLFTPEERELGLAAHEREVAALDGHGEDDRWLVRPDGSRFWAAGVLTSLRDAEGNLAGYAKVFRHRTDQREQAESLRNELAAALAEGKRRDIFLSTLSHELRHPLAPLANAIHILRHTATGQEPPEYEQALRIIGRQMDQLRRLVDDLLDTSRIASGKMDLGRERLAIQELLRAAYEDAAATARDRGVELDLVLPEGAMHAVGDRSRLFQVFSNLAHNAVKFTPAGGRVTLKATLEGTEIVARVQDTGIGIPHDMLPHIFELFTQVDVPYVKSQRGLGIGLSLVKNIVTLHGGTVQAISDGPGKGSEFAVRLPLAT